MARGRVVLMMAAFGLGAGTAHARCTMGKVIDLPVTLRGLQPLVDVTADGHPIRLTLDSGAFFSMLTPGTAGELGLARTGDHYRMTGVGGTFEASVVKVRNFTVSGVSLHNIEFMVGGSEVGSAGLLGQNLLSFRDTEYDLGGGMVRLMDAQGCAGANLAYWAAGKAVSEVKLEPYKTVGFHTVGTIFINNVPIKAIFDTGANLSALSVAAAARAGVRLTDAGVEPAGTSSGLGRKTVRNWIASFGSIRIGDNEEVRATKLRIADMGLTDADMLIGADFFLSHHVYVSNALNRMFITYNGGAVFKLPQLADERRAALDGQRTAQAGTEGAAQAQPSQDDGTDPGDASGYLRRGAARLGRRDLPGALADLDEAVKRDPANARALVERGRIHLMLRQPLLAAADLDQAVRLQPADVETRLMRAGLRLRSNDRPGAREDVDAAAGAAAKSSDARLAIGGLYDALDLPDLAIAQDDDWIAAHPDDNRLSSALNSRCWARALANRDLAKALSDCNAALRRTPNAASYLDSRGLVFLRMGSYDKAIADYDRVLAIDPRSAFSLYDRGLAKLAKGDTAGGRADLSAAEAMNSTVAARARRYGLVPPA